MRRVAWQMFVWSGPLTAALCLGGYAACLLTPGLVRLTGWYLGQLLLPLLGLSLLLSAGLIAWRDRSNARGIQLNVAFAVPCWVVTAQVLGLWTPAYPASIDDSTPHATVRLPLDGPVRVGWGGDTVEHNYHAATPDQRWAYDLLVEPAGHGSADLSSYGCYGLPVVAPADGTVQVAHDGEPDQDPSTFVPNPDAPAGNHVALELSEGTYLLLAHLKPGSLTVATGDAVTEGQVLGLCGNSGNTSEPHVHIHHQRQPVEQIGFAEGLPLFFRDHDGAAMPLGGVTEGEDGSAQFTGDVVQHQGDSP